MGIVVVIAIVMVGLATLLLSVGLFIGKRKEFPSSHVDDSKPLKERGIVCAKEQMRDLYHHKNLQDHLKESEK